MLSHRRSWALLQLMRNPFSSLPPEYQHVVPCALKLCVSTSYLPRKMPPELAVEACLWMTGNGFTTKNRSVKHRFQTKNDKRCCKPEADTVHLSILVQNIGQWMRDLFTGFKVFHITSWISWPMRARLQKKLDAPKDFVSSGQADKTQ